MAGIGILKSLSETISQSTRPQSFHLLGAFTSLSGGEGSIVKKTHHVVGSANGSDQKLQYGKIKAVKGVIPLRSLPFRDNMAIYPTSSISFHRSFSSSSGPDQDSTSIYATNGSNASDLGSDLVEHAKKIWQSTEGALAFAGEKAKEASNELTPYVEKLFETHPYLKDVVVPTGCTLIATILAWSVLPAILRRFHSFAMRSKSLAVELYGSSSETAPISYEKSVWGALEDPLRYMVTFISLSQIGHMVAPNVIETEYLIQAWRGAAIVSTVWFLRKWISSVLARALASQNLTGLARRQFQAVDKVSSVGLVVIGVMAIGEAFGVSVKSILTVGGVGGVATAFASKDIIGNFLSGLSMQLTQPFSIGDTIKAGSVEGTVVDMGLTNTSLLSAEKFPITVPNSMFSSQVIVNKSRAQWRAVVTKIPMQIDNHDKIPEISNAIKSMLKSSSYVFLDNEAPYCFLSHIESTYTELTIGCNLKHMVKEQFYSTQDDIILKAVNIIKQYGGTLAATSQTL